MQILFRPIEPLDVVARAPDWDGALDGFDAATREAVQRRYEETVDRWAQAFGIAPSTLSRTADLEDWTENAVRFLAASGTGLPTHVLKREMFKGAPEFDRTFGDAFDPSAPTLFVGSTLRWEPLYAPAMTGDPRPVPDLRWPVGGHYGRGGDYWRSPTLMTGLNRPAFVSSGNMEGERGYAAMTRRVLAAGADQVIAKIVFQGKYQNPETLGLRREPDGSVSDDAIWKAYYDAFDANLMDCDGRENCFLVQARIPMAMEYRIVVIDGSPVAGAGVLPRLSPIFHDPALGPFDPLMAERPKGAPLESRPDLVGRYLARARALCAQVSRQGEDEFLNCTMDFALDASRDEVVLIETNPLDNFGLYAMDFDAVMEAIVKATAPAPERPGP